MILQDAIDLAQEMIQTRCQNPNYERVCKLHQQYKALITGENAELLLKQFVRREDEDSFKQRLDLTVMITPAVCAALMKPFNKVSWNKKVKKNYDFGTDARNNTVKQMRDCFYGRKKSKNKGLDYWLKTRFPILQFVDPNAWVVIEWDGPESQADVIKPRPFEVTSEMAWHWSVVNEETKWLWVHEDIVFNQLVKIKGQLKADRIMQGVYDASAGDKFTLYDEDNTLVYTQVDPEYLKSINYTMASNEQIWKDPVTKKVFSLKTFTPKLELTPAFRTGYVKDPETDGQTMVNGFHEAMPYLLKSVKTVSEMDLTMSLHAFPQKMQYVQKCPGSTAADYGNGGIGGSPGKRRSCNNGYTNTGEICPACKGSGFKVHTSAQDALFFPFPAEGTLNTELLDLEKLLVYKAPPTALLQFQKDYIESLKNECTYAVFTQTQLTKTTGNVSTPVTATEMNNNMQGVYDALHPFTEKVSDTWIEIICIFGLLAGTPADEEIDVSCIFPPNPQMKSIDELLLNLQVAFAAQAPSFLIDQINTDIAEILYEGDDVAQRMYETKHTFYPFNGQSAAEIALNMASTYVSKFTKVLYANFEAIFSDIDLENVDFWFMSYEEQWKLVEEMVVSYMTEIDTAAMPDLKITTPPAYPDASIPADPANPDAPNRGPVLKPGDPGYVTPATIPNT